MEDSSTQGDRPDEPDPGEAPPEQGRRDAAARAGDLDRMASEARDATFGEADTGRVRVPGIISGDLGPKGRIAAQHRELSRSQRDRLGEVPPGTVAPRGGLLVLVPLLLVALALVAVVVLLGWLLA